MKKILLLCCLILTTLTASSGVMDRDEMAPSNPPSIDPTNGDNNGGSNDGGKIDPSRMPIISIERNVVYFHSSCGVCTLRLLNLEGETEFSARVPVGCTRVLIPSYLLGEYELQIISGGLCWKWPIAL